LTEGDLQADALADLRTEDNQLSVWQIEDDESNLGRVVTALAAGREYIANFDYALVDANLVDTLQVPINNEPGHTPDSEANQRWHRNLTQLTHRQLFDLADLICRQGRVERIQHHQVKESLKRALDSNQLDYQKMGPELLSKLRENTSKQLTGLKLDGS
jgi:hypothetical protein